ncbi:MAG: hypothetical protein V4559_01740 [Pseudomonadota bacterium]
MKKMILGAAFAAMAMGTAPAHADANSEDVRCLIIFMQMSNASAQAAQTGGLIGSFYYMGKLDGRLQGMDLEKLILTEVSQMSEVSFKADAKRCGDDMTKRGQAAADLGKALQQHAQQMQKLGEGPADKDKPTDKPAGKPADKPAAAEKPADKPQ